MLGGISYMSSEIISAVGLFGAALLSGIVALKANRTGAKADKESLVDKRIELLFIEQESDRQAVREELREVRLEMVELRLEHRDCLDQNVELRQAIRALKEQD